MNPGEIVYCAMPCYGRPNATASRQFWARSNAPDGPFKDIQMIKEDRGSSLLGESFDFHWATALNMKTSGYNITRFVMLHSDVVPMDWWLDRLLLDLEESKADVISCLIPLKDLKGLTSTAIDDPSDNWDVLRRLSLSETAKLPEIFTATDCGYPQNMLLINTGCWACDFTKSWCSAENYDGTLKVNFEIRNKIRKDVAASKLSGKGIYHVKVAPEDWEFSRKVQRLGGKIAVTKRISLKHMGDFPFPNHGGWGTYQTDLDLAHKITAALNSREPVIEGWLSEDEGEYLEKLAKDKIVLEIGSYLGRSTVWMARVALQLHAVDTFDGRGTPRPRSTLNEFKANLTKYNVQNKVLIIAGESKDALPSESGIFDLIFLDGAHDPESVKVDMAQAMRLVKPNGVIALHDYSSVDHPGVVTVINSMLGKEIELVDQHKSILVVRLKSSMKSDTCLVGSDVDGTSKNSRAIQSLLVST